MKIRILPLALVIALAACDASPIAPELTRADNSSYMGGGNRDGEASTSSTLIGAGYRDGDGAASTSSILMGGGTRTDEPAPGDASTSSVYMGGGARTDEPTDSASTSSVYMGGGNRDDEPTERNPFLGGSGG